MSKHVEFMIPIDYMTGNLSGHQLLEYGAGGGAYEQPSGQITAATNYEPRLIAKRIERNTLRARSYFQVRTRTAVNMTENMRLNLAVMGGAGAVFASLLQMKESEIYAQCIAAKPEDLTLRLFIMPKLQAALAAKESEITIAQGVVINNPWVAGGSGVTIDVSQVIFAKFNFILGDNTSPYNAAATAALEAAFSADQWVVIRDYGWGNPEIVPYMNAYAPADPKIAYTLVKGIGWRCIIPPDTRSYFNPGYTGLNLSANVRMKFRIRRAGGDNIGIWGHWDDDGTVYRLYYRSASTDFRVQYNGVTLLSNSVSGAVYDIYNIEMKNGKYIINGVVTETYTQKSDAFNRTHLVGCTQADSPEWPSSSQTIEIGEHYLECGNFKSWLIPFDNNGTAELLDLITGQFVPKVGLGPFTIYEEPAA